MIIIICGDRNWTDWNTINTIIASLPKDSTVIHGGANGVDTMAGVTARHSGLFVVPVTAKWKQYGRSAGPIRNSEMLKYGPDVVLAIHNDLSRSKGTVDMIKQATDAEVPIITIKQGQYNTITLKEKLKEVKTD